LRALPLIPFKWNKRIFKEIVGYGLSVQAITITTMLYDPITKALISKFGGLSMVGFYEMASKMVLQFRSLIVSANQVLVPTIADLNESDPERIRSVYLTSYRLLFFLAVSLYALIIIGTPIISEIWIGHYERQFVILGILLAIGWLLNTINVPSYFANMGKGDLKWNVAGHVVIGILNVGLGIALGQLFGGIGVAVAYVIALAIGSAVIYVSYHLIQNIPLSELVPKESRIMLASYAVVVTISCIIQLGSRQAAGLMTARNVTASLSFLFILLTFWLHPMRKRIYGWISGSLFAKNIDA